MQLTKELRERLASEFRVAVALMTASESALEKMYYFSVLYLETGRIINWQWDTDLILIWMVTQQTHQKATAKLQRMAQGDRLAPIPDDYFDHLIEATAELAAYVEKDGSGHDLAQIMGKFAELAYLTTGNGFYLMQKTAIAQNQSPT